MLRSVWGRCGAPDVITKERTDHDKPQYLVNYARKTSFDTTSEDSSSVDFSEQQLSFIDEEIEDDKSSDSKTREVGDEDDSDSEDDFISQIVAQKSPTRITIKLHVTDKISSSWDSVSYASESFYLLSITNRKFPLFFVLFPITRRFSIMTTTSSMLSCRKH